MNGHGEEEQQTAFEIRVVVPKRNVEEKDENCDCIEFLVKELRNLASPLVTRGRAAAQLQMKKATYMGMDLQFEWEVVEAFVRQLDGSLLSWLERFQCYQHLLHGIVNRAS